MRLSGSPSSGGNSGRALRPGSAAMDQPQEELKDDVATLLLSIILMS